MAPVAGERRNWHWLADRLCVPGTTSHLCVAVVASLIMAAGVLTVGMIALGVVVTHIGPLDRWDDRTTTWIADHRTPVLTTISFWGTFIANTLGVIAVAAVATLIGAARRVGRLAATMVCGLGVELVVFLITNYTVARPRPHASHLGSTPSTYSFPSGHAAATLVLYCGIALVVRARTENRLARVAAYVVAVTFPLWVAFSRVYRGQHHPSDVVAGLVMGAAALTGAVLALRAAPALDRARAR